MRWAVFLIPFGIGVGCAQSATIDDPDSGTMDPVDTGVPNCTKCTNGCFDLKTDNSNCGKCGTACPMGATCVQGSCQCGMGQTKCGNTCVDTKTDIQNCGKCENLCGNDAGAIPGGGMYGCNMGTCGIICPSPKIECNGACVDVKTDNDNCGMCGNACDTNMMQQCLQGMCCKQGETVCNGACVNTQSDPMNCGMCGKVCGGNTPGCSMGMCAAYVDHGPM